MWKGSLVTSFASLDDNGVPEQNALYIMLDKIYGTFSLVMPRTNNGYLLKIPACIHRLLKV